MSQYEVSNNLSQLYSDLKGNESKSIQGFQAITYNSIQIRRLDEFNIQRNETRIGTYRKQMRNNGIYMCLYVSMRYSINVTQQFSRMQ